MPNLNIYVCETPFQMNPSPCPFLPLHSITTLYLWSDYHVRVCGNN